MKRIRHTLVASAALACLSMAAAGNAHADAFAQAILTIDNFRLLHASGAVYNRSDFQALTGMNVAGASASTDTQMSMVPFQNVPIDSALTPDIVHQFAGMPTAPRAENDFSPFPNPGPVPGTFGYADQYMRGRMITVGAQTAGVLAQTRADASLQQDGSAAGSSNVGTMSSFMFALGAADSMTFAFDATPFTQAYSNGAPYTNAMARVTWSLNIVNEAGNNVFVFEPSQLNGMSNVNRTDGFNGLTTFAPGTLPFTATSPLLAAGTNYRLTITQTSNANAMQDTQVPEPDSLAIFAAGLLGMGALLRRRTGKH